MGRRPKARARPQAEACDAVARLRAQIHQVHQLLDEQVATASARARFAPAVQRDILSLYAHTLCIEDITVHVLLQAMPPLFTSVGMGEGAVPWDLTSMRDYADLVHAATDAFLARLTLADLSKAIDCSAAGLGRPDATWVLNRFIVWETTKTCGVLAAALHPSARPGARRTRVAASPHARSNGLHRISLDSTDGVASAPASPRRSPTPRATQAGRLASR